MLLQKAWGYMEKNCGIFRSRNTVFTEMERKTRKQEEAKAKKKVARNTEVLGMLKAGVSANQIAKQFRLSYAGAKEICAKLKSSGDCHRTSGSARKRKTSERTHRYIVRQSKLGTPKKTPR